MLPSVSLVVLNWNGRPHLAECLRSLTALDYPGEKLELFVVDNGSRDGSQDLVRRQFPTVRLVELDRNLGFAEPNNLAAEKAGGDWLGFLNNDMRMEPGWLRQLVSGLDDHPRAACLGSRILSWDGSTVEFGGGGVSFTGHGFQVGLGQPEGSADRERRVLFACGGAMLVRHSVYQDLGGFDSDYFAYYEDVDLGWRLNLLGHDVWYTPRASVQHRHHVTGGRLPYAKLRVLYERNALFTIYKCFDDANLAAVLPAALLLLNERALSMAGLDKARFRLGPAGDTVPPARGEGRVAQRLYAFDPAAAAEQPLLARAGQVLAEEGPSSVLRKTARHLRARAGSAAARLLRLPGGVFLPNAAASHYVALSEFAHSLAALDAKRALLQKRRRRSDTELLPLLIDPFLVSYQHPRYAAFQRWLVQVRGLDQRLAAAPD